MQIYKDDRYNNYEVFDNKGKLLKICKDKNELNEFLKESNIKNKDKKTKLDIFKELFNKDYTLKQISKIMRIGENKTLELFYEYELIKELE